MNFIIRRASPTDATNIIEAHRKSIREVCAKDYSAEQISAWAGFNFQEEHWVRTMDRDLVWVVSDDQNQIFGFGHLKFHENAEAEIAGLYFVPKILGQGFGKEIFRLMLEQCRERQVRAIRLTATKAAKTFYEHICFQQIGSESTLRINGKDIECFKMSQTLA